MGLYLVVFDESEELDGVDVGHYADFEAFRVTVLDRLERNMRGARFPILMLHSDCDGQWTPQESSALLIELEEIAARFRELPPTKLNSDWQRSVAKTFGVELRTLYDCFFDVDGEPLLQRLISLARLSSGRQLPILFQ